MMIGDFFTLTQMGLPVKVIVLNHGLKNPNFALMADAVGVRGIRVEKPQELKAAIAKGDARDPERKLGPRRNRQARGTDMEGTILLSDPPFAAPELPRRRALLPQLSVQ